MLSSAVGIRDTQRPRVRLYTEFTVARTRSAIVASEVNLGAELLSQSFCIEDGR